MTARTIAAEDEVVSPGGITFAGVSVSTQVIGIALGAIGLVGAGFILLQYIQPLRESIAASKSSIEQRQGSIQSKESEVTKKKDFPQKVEDSKARRTAVLGLLPSEDNADTLILDINARLREVPAPVIVSPIANISGNAFKSRLDDFTPTKTTEGTAAQPFRTKEYRLAVSATYQDTLEFMRRLEKLRPLLIVKDISMKKSNLMIDPGALTPEQKNYLFASLPPLITTNFNLIAYIPLTQDELAELEAKANASKK